MAHVGTSVLVQCSRKTLNCLEFPFAERTSVKDTRNEEYTERAVNPIVDTQEVQLGAYQDTAPIHQGEVSNEIMMPVQNNFTMEGFDLNGALSREYLVSSLTWPSSAISGTLLETLQFPKLLFDQSFVSSKISDFRYFRGGVRLTIRVTTNKFLYGKLLVCYNPRPFDDRFDTSSMTLWQASGFPHMVISASAGEAAVFDVPFISPKRVLDLSDYQPDEIGHFRIFVLNDLTSVTPDIDDGLVVITAQFLESELYLPHDSVVAPEETLFVVKGGKLVRQEKVVTQSKRGAEAYRKSVAGVSASKNEVHNSMSSSIRSTRRTVGRAFSRVAEGVATNVLTGMAMAGLSKPTTLETTSVGKINPYHDLPSGKGIDCAIKLGMDPENQISTQPNVAGIEDDEMDFKYLLGVPSLTTIRSFVDGTPPTEIATLGPYAVGTPSLSDFVVQHFKYWSGSYKFKFYITASLFHAVRGVFWLGEIDTIGTTLSNWENCYHKVVDIQGDTEVEFSVPYSSSFVAAKSDEYPACSIWFLPLSWSQPDSALSCPIHINVYKACDSDFQLGALMEKAVTVQSNPRADFARAFEALHESFTGYEHEGLLYGEKYTTLREVVHRNLPIKLINTAVTYVEHYTSGVTQTADYYWGPEMWGLYYRFYRGSMRHRFMHKATDVVSSTGYMSIENDKIQGVTLSSSTNPLLEIEMPWYSRDLFRSTTIDGGNNYRFYKSTLADSFWCKSCGDDFSFHFVRLPPITAVVDVPATGNFGVLGITTFYSSV